MPLMNGIADTTVQIDPPAPEEGRMPIEQGASDNKGPSLSSKALASGGSSAQAESPHKSEPKVFWLSMVRITSNGLRLPLQLFMAKADEYPRFVWQNYLLTFQACRQGRESQDGDQRGFGPFGPQQLSLIVEFYPDIIQRELLRDSFELAEQGPKKIRYGALHAAVLCGRLDLVHLIKDPDLECRKKILKRLTPEARDVSLSTFIFLRRAVLWNHMHESNASYKRVATFMMELEKVRMPKGKELDGLRDFIEKTAEDIDFKDHCEPWIVVLAWSAISRWSKHILEEFKGIKPEVFKKILTMLEEWDSPFKPFLSFPLEQKVTSPKGQGQSQRGQELTVPRILELLVLGPAEDVDVQERDDEEITAPKYDFMQKYFLDRLSERTPTFRWSPLHFAAAYGNHEMVSLLILSCDKILDKLGKGVKSIYVTNLQNSFHDAKFMTPLHYAVLGNHKDVVACLLDWKLFHPYVNDRDIFMRTAFQIACSEKQRKEIAEQLLSSKLLDIDTTDCCSYTGVHWAVFSCCTETARSLIQKNKLFAYKEGLVPLIKKLEMKDSQKLLLNLSSMKTDIERLYRDRQVYVDASNAILVGAALIASVTFGGWLQPPLGNDEDANYRKVELSVFWAFNSLSFFFATATVMSGAAAVLPVGGFDHNMEREVESIRTWLAVTSLLLVISVMFVLVAFAAGGFSSLSLITILDLRANMSITTGIGSAVCAIIGYLFCLRLWSVIRPQWLNEILDNIRDPLKEEGKEEILRIVKTPFQILSTLPGQAKEHFSALLLFCLSMGICWMSLVKRCYTKEVDSSSRGRHDSNHLIGPVKPGSLSLVMMSLPTIAGSGSEPYAIHHKKIEKMWIKMHPKTHSKGCPIRDCYKELEKISFEEIIHFNIGSEASLQDYVEMWKTLSQKPVKDIAKTLKTVKEITPLGHKKDFAVTSMKDIVEDYVGNLASVREEKSSPSRGVVKRRNV